MMKIVYKFNYQVSIMYLTQGRMLLLFARHNTETLFSISKDVTDIHVNKSRGKVYLLNHFKLGELETRFQTCIIKPEQYLFGNVSGILGTDVISRADWCIDFKEKKIMAGSTIPNIAILCWNIM